MSTPSSPGSSMRANASSSTAHGNLTNDNNSDGPSPSKNSGSIEPSLLTQHLYEDNHTTGSASAVDAAPYQTQSHMIAYAGDWASAASPSRYNGSPDITSQGEESPIPSSDEDARSLERLDAKRKRRVFVQWQRKTEGKRRTAGG